MLRDSFQYPENVFASVYVHGWNLGDVCLTVGIQQLLESEEVDEDEDEDGGDMPLIWQQLEAHLWGHAGLASDEESCTAKMQCGRVEGRPFASVWFHGDEVIKIVTNQARRITTVCLVRED